MLSRLSKKLIITFAVLSVFVFTISFAVIDLQEGLVSYWSFDTEFPGSVDIAGTPTSGTVTPDTAEANNENNALVQGATPTPGPSNTAYLFDGSSSLTVSDSDSLDLDEDLSLSFWMNPGFPENFGDVGCSSSGSGLFVKDSAFSLCSINEVLNASFEEDSPALDDWTEVISATGSTERDTVQVLFGEASLKLQMTNSGSSGDGVQRHQGITASEGDIWSVGTSIFVEALSGANAMLRMTFRDSGGSIVGSTFTETLPVNADFEEVEIINKTAPASTDTIRIQLRIEATGSGAIGTAYFDGVTAVKNDELVNLELDLTGVTSTPFQSNLLLPEQTSLYTVTRDGTTGDVIFCRGLFGAAIPVCDDAISGGTESLTTNTNDLVMGENFEGVLDEMRLWDRVLSLDEITFMQTIFPETVISQDLKSGADFIASLFLLPKDVFATGIIGIIGLVLYAATRTVHLMLGFILAGVFIAVIYEYYDWWLLLIPVGLVTVFIILRITKIIKPREAE